MNVTNIGLENLGTVNKNKVKLTTNGGCITLYFSYETCVGFIAEVVKNGYNITKCVRQNDWSKTTGKFLNELEPDHTKRVSSEEFERRLSKLLNS